MAGNIIPTAKVNRTMFNLSHDKKFTGNMGVIYPELVMDCVPGDVIKLSNASWINFQPMTAPFLEDIVVKHIACFVPYRILDENFESIVMMSEMLKANDSIENIGVDASGVEDYGDGSHRQGAIKVLDGTKIDVPKWFNADNLVVKHNLENTDSDKINKVIFTDTDLNTVSITKDDDKNLFSKKFIYKSGTNTYEDKLIAWCKKRGYLRSTATYTVAYYKDTTLVSSPTFTVESLNKHDKNSLWDYMGFPIGKTVPAKTSAPFDYLRRAYYLCWNELFRDEELQNEVDITDVTNDVCLRVGWERDYFTSARLTQQLGVAPALPLSGQLPLTEIYKYAYGEEVPANIVIRSPLVSSGNGGGSYYEYATEIRQGMSQAIAKYSSGSGAYGGTTVRWQNPDGSNDSVRVSYTCAPHNAGTPLHLNNTVGDGNAVKCVTGMTEQEYANNPISMLGIDATNLATFDIADVRLASALQRWKERNNRTGVRYTEYLQANYGVFPRDDRLQRPEIIGSYKTIINSNPVIQTAVDTSATDNTPVGTRYGNASKMDSGYLGKYHAQEFGCIISFVYAKPKSNYVAQGINRQFLKDNVYDFFNPLFTHISDQEIRNEEIFMSDSTDVASGSDDDADKLNNGVWGFQDRYQEMRHMPNIICSEFRDKFDYWHFGRKFDKLPNLTGEFIECNPTVRPFAVQDEDTIMFDCGNIIKALRPIPYMSTPSLS